MDLNPIILSIPIYFILIAAEVIYDRVKHSKLYRLHDAITNISCGITEQVTGVFMKVFTVAVYVFFYEYFRVYEVPRTWYWAIVLFIGVDFFYYWAHRYSHEINLFWTGHVIHHQSEDYNLSVALRQGVFQKVFTSVFFIPLAIAGFAPDWFVYIGAFSTLYQFWIHTQLIDKMGWFGYIFNTPSHHRVHHGIDPKYIDKNHGGTFILFDRMFGTFQAEEEKPTYGITNPIATFDPIRAHLKPFQGLWEDMKLIKGWKNKFLLLWKPPGWLPEESGGFRPPKEVDKAAYQKYDQPATLGLGIYLIGQYLVLMGITSIFLFTANQVNLDTLLFALLLLYAVMTMGIISDGKKYAMKMELIRIVLLVVFCVARFARPETMEMVAFIGAIYLLGSSAALYFLNKKQKMEPHVR